MKTALLGTSALVAAGMMVAGSSHRRFLVIVLGGYAYQFDTTLSGIQNWSAA